MTTKIAAVQAAAANILGKQKSIDALRKAAREAKTRLNDAKRNVKNAEQGLKYTQERNVGEYNLTAEKIASYIAAEETRVAAAKERVPAAAAELVKAMDALAIAEAALPSVKESAFAAILKWFSGTSLIKAKDALELLDASVTLGCWLPGASRKVRAAVGKPNVAKKSLKLNTHYDASKAESALHFAVKYGSFDRMERLSPAETSELPATAKAFLADFMPLVTTMARLDATRPIATFTNLGVSATVTATLRSLDAATVEVCPMKFETVERKDKNGKTVYETVAILLWPEGTKHSTSRYAYGTANNSQCEACGHAIKNGFNWVPLILTDRAGTPKSLWVGRDCSKSLFGIELTGELEIKDGKQ